LSIKRAEEIAKECKVKFSLEQPIWGLIKYIRSDYKRNSAKKYDSRSNVKIKKRVSQNGRKPPCILPFTEMTIFAEGTVSPCCILWKREPEHIGDSVLDESLDKIWYGILFDHFRSKMKSGELPKYCRGCFL
jgi:MoaA/NifB/PqqE/SkfB family radical SAM enzyme